MTDILDHLQPDSPLYEATRDAAREEITRLRYQLKEMAEALEEVLKWFDPGDYAAAIYVEAGARGVLSRYRGNE